MKDVLKKILTLKSEETLKNLNFKIKSIKFQN
jgi:hypothetical protein